MQVPPRRRRCKSGQQESRLSESQAFTQAMDALFHPKRIAVVGATPRLGFAHNIHRAILRGGYEGEVFGVNPKYDEVLGSPTYPTIDAIPGGVDKAIVVVPSPSCWTCWSAASRGRGEGRQHHHQRLRRAGRRRGSRAPAGDPRIRPAHRHPRRRARTASGLISTPAKLIAKSGPYTTVKQGPISIVFQSGLLAYSHRPAAPGPGLWLHLRRHHRQRG